MAESPSFTEEIEFFENRLQLAREELAELERKHQTHDVEIQKCRQSIRAVRQIMEGKLPETRRSQSNTQSVEQLEVNPDTGRPSRGARRDQIERICLSIGATGEAFRTVDMLNKLREVEGDLSDGMKSYAYAVMSKLQDDQVIEKVGRGKWTLTS